MRTVGSASLRGCRARRWRCSRRATGAGTRDDSIYRNVAGSYDAGKRHAAILGALRFLDYRTVVLFTGRTP